MRADRVGFPWSARQGKGNSISRRKTLRLEPLEPRLLLSVQNAPEYLLSQSADIRLESALVGNDELAPMPGSVRTSVIADTALVSLDASPVSAASYSVLPNGMPILHSRSGAAAAIFIDFDGQNAGPQPTPYDEDGDPSAFNATEAANIAECWRQLSMYFAMFDADVTTIQPDVAVTPTAWVCVSNSISGGYSHFAVFPNTVPHSFNNSGDARGRVSGIAHEVGHNFGLNHQSTFDLLGNRTASYASAADALHGPIMGVDYDGFVHKWITGHMPGSPSTLQDDVGVIANAIRTHAAAGYTGDGYAPDDYGDTIAIAAPLADDGVSQTATGIIERLTDLDAFSFTSSGGRYHIVASRDAPSGVDLKLAIYDAAGVLVASEDGDPAASPLTMVNDQQISLTLPAGTYFAIVGSHGNYGDQGQYNLVVSPLPDGWAGEAVGMVGQLAPPGYAAYDAATATLTVAASGGDIWGTSDSFQYAYQTLQGDGTIVAQVVSMEGTDSWAKAGLMFRETLADNSRDVGMLMSYQNGPQMVWRSSTGGSTAGYYPSSAAFAPTWLKLVRSGNTFTGYKSSDGASWNLWTQATVVMNSTIYVGLVNCAHNQSKLNTATFTNVAVIGNLNPGPAINVLAAPSGLSASASTSGTIGLSWNDQSGETGYVIERSSDGDRFVQAGTTAANVTAYTDSSLSGDQRYYYRVRAQDAAGVSTPSSVVHRMTRADAVTGLAVTSWTTSQLILNWRDASGETGYRVERSANGTSGWATLATLGPNIPSYTNGGLTTATQYYYRVVTLDASGDAATAAIVSGTTRLDAVTGIAFTSKIATQMTLQWNSVAGATGYRVLRSTDGTNFSTLTTVAGTSFADASVSPLGEYYYRVVATTSQTESIASTTTIFAAAPAGSPLPGPWQAADVGAVSGTGAAGHSSGTFTLVGNGSDIWGSADQFHFVYATTITGNGSIIARVTAQENTAGWAKQGVMIRSSLDAGAKYALTAITPGNGAVFEYRGSTNGSAARVAGPAAAAPYWVKLIRTGDTFTSQVSSDGVAWTTVGSATISIGSTMYVGLAGDSNTTGTLNTSTFTGVAWSFNAPPTDIAISANSLPENNGIGAPVGTFSTTDPDTGNTFTYSLVSGTGGTDNASFTISGNTLQAAASFDYDTKSSCSIRVRSADQGGLYFEEVFIIVVANVNETPTDLALSNSGIAENQPPPAGVGTLSTTDPDAGNTFTYSFVAGSGDADNASFTISGSTLQTAATFNYEAKNSYSVRVRSTDQGGLYTEREFVITVADINEAPADIALSTSTIPENRPALTTLATLSSTDPDPGNTFAYGLVSGSGSADNASFMVIGGTLRVAVSFNYEVKDSYSLRLRTTDQGGLYTEKAFTINVTNVNERPSDLSLSNSAIAENQPAPAAVGTLSSTDPDAGSTFTYGLVSGTGGTDNASFTISGNTLQTATAFNHEGKDSYSIRVRTTDQGGMYIEEVLAISVADVNEAPAAAPGGPYLIGAGFDLALNAGGSSDPDAGGSIASYQWDLDGDGQYDEFVAASPTVSVPYPQLAALGEGIHTIGLQVTDTGGLTGTASTTLEIKGGTLTGTSGNDTFRIVGRSNDPTIADVFVNNSTATPSYSVVLAAVPGWQVLVGEGSDSLVLEGTSVQLAGSDPYFAGTSLGIGDGATAALTPGLSATLQIRGLAIAGGAVPTGTLDLADGQLIVDGAVTSEAVVRDYLTAGCNGGTWGGPGITSSQAAADAVKYTVGYCRNGDLGEDAFGQWFGHSVNADSILVRRTYVGDTDLDGNITTDDFDLWKYGYAEGLQGWHNGDLDYNGVVDTDDFDLWKYAFTFGYDPLSSPDGAAAAMVGAVSPTLQSATINLATGMNPAAVDAVFAESAEAGAEQALLSLDPSAAITRPLLDPQCRLHTGQLGDRLVGGQPHHQGRHGGMDQDGLNVQPQVQQGRDHRRPDLIIGAAKLLPQALGGRQSVACTGTAGPDDGVEPLSVTCRESVARTSSHSVRCS